MPDDDDLNALFVALHNKFRQGVVSPETYTKDLNDLLIDHGKLPPVRDEEPER
jgi:hypothetical protein